MTVQSADVVPFAMKSGRVSSRGTLVQARVNGRAVRLGRTVGSDELRGERGEGGEDGLHRVFVDLKF